MPYPRPSARPWAGFGLMPETPPPEQPSLRLQRLMRKAHAAERAAALAYRGHRTCFAHPDQRRMIHRLAVDEWRHRAWLQRRLLAHFGLRPATGLESGFALIGVMIGLACLFITPFLASYFAGRLERDNGHEYDALADGLLRESLISSGDGWDRALRHMARAERRHERQLLAVVRSHPLLPVFARAFRWPLAARGPAATVYKAYQRRPQQVVLALPA